MKDRIYVCHTFYHVYVTFLKELALPKEQQGGATIVLSTMSTDFGNLQERLLKLNYLEDVIMFNEQRETYFPELAKYKVNHGNIIINMFYRIRFTSKFAKCEASLVPVDFKQYKEIYVFCDADPIGVYLNKNHIYYHAMEDGLDAMKTMDEARLSNIGFFGVKAFMASLNLIFIEHGYSKYCLDMEVNDRSVIKHDYKKFKEVPRAPFYDRLTREDKDLLLRAFVDNKEELEAVIKEVRETHESSVLLLSDPVCEEDVRERMMKDLVEEYSPQGRIFIKQHPRDMLDYKKILPDIPLFSGKMPMEILNFFEGIHFDTVVSVYTELGEIKFADKKVRLSDAFMDKYEDPERHWSNNKI